MLQEEDINGDAECVLCQKNAFPHDSDTTNSNNPYFYSSVAVRVCRPCGHAVHEHCLEVWIARRDLCSNESRARVCPECGVRFQSQECVNATRSKELTRPGNFHKTFGHVDLELVVRGLSELPDKEGAKYSEGEVDQPEPRRKGRSNRRQTGRAARRARRRRVSADNLSVVEIIRPIHRPNHTCLPDAYFESLTGMIDESRTCSLMHILRITVMIFVGIMLLLYSYYM